MAARTAQRRQAHRATGLAVVLALAAVAPGSAAGDEPRAERLRASADHLGGFLLGTNGNVVTIGVDDDASVEMPPQSDTVVVENEGGTFQLLGDAASGRRTNSRAAAGGDVAAGTAFASAEDTSLTMQVMGVPISVRTLRSESRSSCDGPGTAQSASAGSALVELVVAGEVVPVGDVNTVAHRVEAPEGRGTVEVSALQVEPLPDGTGWVTSALVVRATPVLLLPRTVVVAGPPTLADFPVANELVFGRTETSLLCRQPEA